ncbi:D-tyrosyl-tRNA(Tyr) deacylase [Desulfovibrio sp. X2]|uniref:D-aminoacyl-tRNA deacylase n=1 Tax=Desulfovibrio sp. X2 TaxID=941449 RepID=UPI000358F0B3|nr:D-aminoacyl-tRNA deacylase [Desulfovibrio sp. X2]EPR43893.1 D-tyrosyl-tRNA(Tyr) deacylase [Desulfovibrio sp. X2]
MRLLLQRVRRASVAVDGAAVGEIGEGLLCLAGFGPDDGEDLPELPRWHKTIDKMLDLRIFPDEDGRFNRSLQETGGGLLLVSQFTLYADCRKGRRPSFSLAAPPDTARRLFERLVAEAERRLPGRTASGVFGADMDVLLTNWGPVTIMLDDAALWPAAG